MLKVILAFVAVVALASCQKLGQQDPLADQPDWVRDAQIEGEKKQKLCIEIEKDMIIEGSSDVLNFKETVASSFTFTGRVLRPNLETSLIVENLAQFKGATFDKKTGEFKWTPEKNFSGGEMVKEATLKIRMLVSSKTGNLICDKLSISHNRDFQVYVQRAEGSPIITKVEGLVGANIHERQLKRFKVTVKDPDSIDDQPPTLVVNPTRGSSIAGFIELEGAKPVKLAADPSSWEFSLILDLTNAEITNSSQQFDFALIAYSRFGKPSPIHNAQVLVYTDLSDPVVSAKAITVEATKEFTYTFYIMDIKEEGRLDFSAPNISALPGTNKTLSCTKPMMTQIECTLKYTAPLEAINKKFQVQVPYTSRSPATGDPLSISKVARFDVSVIAPKPHPLTEEVSQ